MNGKLAINGRMKKNVLKKNHQVYSSTQNGIVSFSMNHKSSKTATLKPLEELVFFKVPIAGH
jgi:hypothetical protein